VERRIDSRAGETVAIMVARAIDTLVSNAARWALLAAFVAAGALSSWLEPVVVGASPALRDAALASVRDGTASGYAFAAAAAAGWLGLVVLLKPMLVFLCLVALETFATGARPEWRTHRLGFLIRASFLALTYLAGMALTRVIGPLPGPLLRLDGTHPSWAVKGVEASCAFLALTFIIDFFQYWAHRAYHRFGFLWTFHAVHHSPRELSVLHNFGHPVEKIITFFLVTIPATLVIGVGGDQFLLITAFFVVQADLAHSKAALHLGRLGSVLVDNRFHFIHHSRRREDYDVNFAAVYPVLDRLFGTYKAPDGETLRETGLEDRLPPRRLVDYYLARLPAAG
jgi:sterol desaturase/sphingolipid hydroxylase (fatty acid hydroxylase superfamily)